MVNITDMDDIDDQLKNLDLVNTIINGMKDDKLSETQRKDFMAKADKLIKEKEQKTVINATRINTNPTSIRPNPSFEGSNAAAMSAMAADADERFKRKQKNMAKATVLKDKGNAALKREQFDEAEQFYSDGLELVRDFKQLWTNRAICRIKMKKYKDAIQDCDWALKLDENCGKAIIQTGHAYLEMGNYEQSAQWYQKLKLIGQESLAIKYLQRLSIIKKQNGNHAIDIQNLPQKNKADFENMINNIRQINKDPIYYHGGLLLLETTLENQPHLVPFFNTFELFHWNHPIMSWWSKCSTDDNTQIEIVACLWRLTNIATRNDHHLAEKIVSGSKFVPATLQGLNNQTILRTECLLTLFRWSVFCANKILSGFGDVYTPFFKVLLSSENFDLVMKLLANLSVASSSSLLRDLRNMDSEFIQLIQINSLEFQKNPAILDSIHNILEDEKLRNKVGNHLVDFICDFYTAQCSHVGSLNAIKLANRISSAELGTDASVKMSSQITLSRQMEKDNQMCAYFCNMMGTLAQKCVPATEIVSRKYLNRVFDWIKSEQDDIAQINIRCLAVITERCPESRTKLIGMDPKMLIVSKKLKHQVEKVRGNTALIISNCVELLQEDPIHLIEPLIQLVDQAKNKSNRTNGAIALSKVAKYSDKCREQFRELHGLEILQSRMSQIKI